MRGHGQSRETFEQNPGPHIIKYCNRRVKEVRMKVNEKAERNNIRYYRDYTLLYKGNIILLTTNEIIRMIDAVEEEQRYI